MLLLFSFSFFLKWEYYFLEGLSVHMCQCDKFLVIQATHVASSTVDALS